VRQDLTKQPIAPPHVGRALQDQTADPVFCVRGGNTKRNLVTKHALIVCLSRPQTTLAALLRRTASAMSDILEQAAIALPVNLANIATADLGAVEADEAVRATVQQSQVVEETQAASIVQQVPIQPLWAPTTLQHALDAKLAIHQLLAPLNVRHAYLGNTLRRTT
jgi:hypothetical protein